MQSKSFTGIRDGNLEVTLGRTPEEIIAAQKLRYRIFCDELGAKFSNEKVREQRDSDEFDPHCHHLLVVDHDKPSLRDDNAEKIVGVYRLLTRDRMQPIGRFYSESEFDISKLKAYAGNIMELGRSCVDMPYRSRSVMQLLWKGIGSYISVFDVDIMFGCASFSGVDPREHQAALSYLHHYHLAPEELRVTPAAGCGVNVAYMPKESLDVKAIFTALPTLIKGYLRLGGVIGDGVVVDRMCNTTDVAIIVKSDLIGDRYVQRFGQSKT